MGLRRLFGLFLMLTMANVATASSDLVCVKHAGGHHAAPETAAPGVDHHAEPEAPGEEPCKVPVRSDCCVAVTSCTPSLSLAAAGSDLGLAVGRAAQPRSIDEMPLTRLIPPDPPPPKV